MMIDPEIQAKRERGDANVLAKMSKYFGKIFRWKLWLAFVVFAAVAHVYVGYFMPTEVLDNTGILGDAIFFAWVFVSAVMFASIAVMMWVVAYKLIEAQATNPNLAGWQSFLVVAFIITMSFVIPGAEFWEMIKYVM